MKDGRVEKEDGMIGMTELGRRDYPIRESNLCFFILSSECQRENYE